MSHLSLLIENHLPPLHQTTHIHMSGSSQKAKLSDSSAAVMMGGANSLPSGRQGENTVTLITNTPLLEQGQLLGDAGRRSMLRVQAELEARRAQWLKLINDKIAAIKKLLHWRARTSAGANSTRAHLRLKFSPVSHNSPRTSPSATPSFSTVRVRSRSKVVMVPSNMDLIELSGTAWHPPEKRPKKTCRDRVPNQRSRGGRETCAEGDARGS